MIANILAEPLISIAQRLAGVIPPHGVVVLSGILHSQGAAVLAAYPDLISLLMNGRTVTWAQLTYFAVPMTIAAVMLRAPRIPGYLRTEMRYGVGGGVMACFGYSIVLWSMSQASMATVAAVRETSVIFAALIGTRLLGEPFGTRRTLASVGVAAGIVLLTSS